eukprot:2198015-Pleurochrysis_carterae.AAC.1
MQQRWGVALSATRLGDELSGCTTSYVPKYGSCKHAYTGGEAMHNGLIRQRTFQKLWTRMRSHDQEP